MRNNLMTMNSSETCRSAFSMNKIFAITLLSGLVMQPRAMSQVPAVQLYPGDIVYTDSGDAINGGFVIKVDSNKVQTVIASGGNLRMPFGVVVDSNGQIVVSDSGRLIHIDPKTQIQTVIADSSAGKLGSPYGIDIDISGQVLAANAQALVRVDPASGQTAVVSSGANFGAPLGVAVADNGEIYVANVAFPGEIVRVNPQNGSQKVIASGQYLNSPRSIAIQGNDIYVTDVINTNINYGLAGRVIHVDAHTGVQRVVSEGRLLVDPVGIAVDANGQIIVGDPSTVNPKSLDPSSGGYDGAIIRIDPITGDQTPLARGQGSYVNPRGVAVVPAAAITAKR
jgi:sugar lactone lactonase YvrE